MFVKTVRLTLPFLVLNLYFSKAKSSLSLTLDFKQFDLEERKELKEDTNINYFGVAFQPYTKYADNGQFPLYETYTMEDVKAQLKVINANHRHNLIGTYSSGADWYNENGGCNYGNCIVAQAAAEINRDMNSVVISVSQGIYQKPNNPNLQKREIDWAFDQAQRANGIRGGTVWGLTFTNEYITHDGGNGNEVLQMVQANKQRANGLGLRVGIRTHMCHQFSANGGATHILTQIVQQSDFIMCNIYPAMINGHVDVDTGISQVTTNYARYRDAIKSINRNIEVMIGETGWASEGQTFFNPPAYNTIPNMQRFWEGIRNWAATNQVRVHMFEAIDEPNKDASTGEGERHFGWWRRERDNSNRYIEKTTNQRAP